MKIRKHMVLIVGGGTALILMLVALFMLYRFYRDYDGVNTDLQNAMNQLRTLQNRAPYPSKENVAVTETNLVIFQNYFTGLFKTLQQGQIEPIDMEAAKFTPLLRDGILRVSKRAQDAGVVLPKAFAMGVERYKQGALPSGGDVPRLVVQLKTLEALCDLLIDSKVSEIVSVRRRIFEQGAAQDAAQGDAARFGRWGSNPETPEAEAAPSEVTQDEVMDPSGLFSIEHYVIEFKCHESSVWNILNTLAKSKLYAVVTRLTISNDNAVLKLVAKPKSPVTAGTPPASGTPGSPTEGPIVEVKSQDERVIAGRELVNVVLDVDVYRFLGGEKQEAKQ